MNLGGDGNTYSSQPPNLLAFYKTIGKKEKKKKDCHKKEKVKKKRKRKEDKSEVKTQSQKMAPTYLEMKSHIQTTVDNLEQYK